MRVKTVLYFGLIAGLITASIFVYLILFRQEAFYSPLGRGKLSGEKKLNQYSYDSLRQMNFSGSQIITGRLLKDEDYFRSYLFYFTVRGKRVSGLLNLPKAQGSYPIVIMLRGYVDREIYQTGVGTRHGGEVLAQNGFITLAPDFLDYGYSDKTKLDSMESRFMTYVTALELLASVKNLNTALQSASLNSRFDEINIGLWGHSNGGQIALSVLEITGKVYPTVLWAPVSKPFPYSILYYTDDIPDHGKALRRVVADFEKDYDSEKYSLTNYFDWIDAPIQIHQGESDESVPLLWSDTLVKTLQTNKKQVEYFTYPDEDHNFDQGSWDLIMQRTMDFFSNHFN